MFDKIEEFAESILGQPIEMEWSRELNGCQVSRWTQANYAPPFTVLVVQSPIGIYSAASNHASLERFLGDIQLDLSDVDAAIEIIRYALPGTRDILFEDPDGEMRYLYGLNWESPTFKDGKLIFYCNHAERAMKERFSIKGAHVTVEDIEKGSPDLLL